MHKWLKEVNIWKKGRSPDIAERGSVIPERIARVLVNNLDEILDRFEKDGWADEAASTAKVLDYTMTQLPKDEVNAVKEIIEWPKGSCEKKLFGIESMSYDLGESVSGRVLSGTAIHIERNSCYPLAVIAAAKGLGTSLAEIERSAYKFQQEQRDMLAAAEDKMNSIVAKINNISKSPIWKDKYVPHSIMKEANMWHSIKEVNHGMLLEAMMWAWPMTWEEFEKLGVIAVEVDEEDNLDMITHSDMSEHDKWVVIKVQREHAKPISFGCDNKTILTTEEINNMSWFREQRENQERCCERKTRPSNRTLEELMAEPRNEIEYFNCEANKRTTKCQGMLIRQKSHSIARMVSGEYFGFQRFLGMNTSNPSLERARELQFRHRLNESLCMDLLSKYPLSTVELVSIKLEERYMDAPLDLANYILSILEMDTRFYPSREWTHSFNKMQEHITALTKQAISKSWS